MARTMLRLGDVFTVPIDETRVGIGQTVARYGATSYYFAIFDKVFDPTDPIDIDLALNGRLLFLALSLDARIYHGMWKVIGNRPVVESLPLPAYKVARNTADNVFFEDYSGRISRKATPAEAEDVPNRKTVAPIRLERALQAKNGVGPWSENYADLTPNEAATTKKIFGSAAGSD